MLTITNNLQTHLVVPHGVAEGVSLKVPPKGQVQVERVKAFVVLKDPGRAGPEMEEALIVHSREHLIKWSCPREIEFRTSLPKTLVGKVAFNCLEEEEKARLKAAGLYAGEKCDHESSG